MRFAEQGRPLSQTRPFVRFSLVCESGTRGGGGNVAKGPGSEQRHF